MQDWQTLQHQHEQIMQQCNEKKTNRRNNNSKKNAKVVTFSAMSDMFTYPPDDASYARNDKAYSKLDRKAFHSEAWGEAMRIRRTILDSSSSGSTSQVDASADYLSSSSSSMMEEESLLHLLKSNILSIEEMIGIEQMIFSSSSNNGSNNRPTWSIFKERKDHVRAIVAEQRRLRKETKDIIAMQHEQRLQCEIWQQQHEDEDASSMIIRNKKLGEYSEARSAKSVQKARFRAALAA